MAKDKEDKPIVVRCMCANVHLGNGVILRGVKNKQGNYGKDGETAEVEAGLARMLIDSDQCEKV